MDYSNANNVSGDMCITNSTNTIRAFEWTNNANNVSGDMCIN